MFRFSIYQLGSKWCVEDLRYSCIQGSFDTFKEAEAHKKQLEYIVGRYL